MALSAPVPTLGLCASASLRFTSEFAKRTHFAMGVLNSHKANKIKDLSKLMPMEVNQTTTGHHCMN